MLHATQTALFLIVLRRLVGAGLPIGYKNKAFGEFKEMTEWHCVIFALRMPGLFKIIPVFSGYAKTILGGDNVLLVGIALGAYVSRPAASSRRGRTT